MPRKSGMAGQHLVHDAAERPDVGAAVERQPARLLGAHVGGRPHHRVGAGLARRQRVRSGLVAARIGDDGFGQAEVEHLHHAVGRELDVGRLQIAVDDALFVRGVERVHDLAGDADHLGKRQAAPGRGGALQVFVQRVAFDQLHHQRQHAALFLEAEERGDVGMVEGGQDAGFALEPCDAFGIGDEGLGQRLQRDVAAQVRVMRPIHLAHSALTYESQDFVDSELSSWRQWHASELSAAGL